MYVCAYAQSRQTLLRPQYTVACQTPLFKGCPRQEYWSGLPLPAPGDLPDPGIEPVPPVFPILQADSLPLHYLGCLFNRKINKCEKLK